MLYCLGTAIIFKCSDNSIRSPQGIIAALSMCYVWLNTSEMIFPTCCILHSHETTLKFMPMILKVK